MILLGSLAVLGLGLIDWFTLRAAWLAEDAGPRFSLGVTTILLDIVRIGALAPLAVVISRQVGLGVGIAASAATFFVWRPLMGGLPGATLDDPSQHTWLIPTWSWALILIWTLAVIGFWVALLWRGLNWPTRVRNAAPFLVAAATLLAAAISFS
ncbi:MAG: hypothetical protein LWW77_08115 [Propionibacteriales bacterium]|nr:hypothetical protein [Propionibacteriales bacterium]